MSIDYIKTGEIQNILYTRSKSLRDLTIYKPQNIEARPMLPDEKSELESIAKTDILYSLGFDDLVGIGDLILRTVFILFPGAILGIGLLIVYMKIKSQNIWSPSKVVIAWILLSLLYPIFLLVIAFKREAERSRKFTNDKSEEKTEVCRLQPKKVINILDSSGSIYGYLFELERNSVLYVSEKTMQDACIKKREHPHIDKNLNKDTDREDILKICIAPNSRYLFSLEYEKDMLSVSNTTSLNDFDSIDILEDGVVLKKTLTNIDT